MVEEKTSTRALTGQRMMHKNLPRLEMEWDPAAGGFAILTTFPDNVLGWQKAGPFTHYIEDYFDTSGYTMDFLTTMPMSSYVQEAGRYQVTFPGTLRMLVLDLITTERINDIATFAGQIVGNEFPSFTESTDDFSQLIYGRFREFTGITQGTAVQDVFAPVSNQQFGSLEATTADKLWIYKLVIMLGIPQDPDQNLSRAYFPGSRFILNAEIVKEGDLPFMMRQKRSYELTNY